MKKVFTVLMLVLFIVLLGFVLTKTTYEPLDSLIRPPKIEGENAEIQAAFESSLDGGYLLKSPLAGEYRSSFILKNIDADTTDEVIVFYAKTDSVDVVRMNILDNSDGKWETVADIESTYSDIYQIKFADVDNDNVTEIIVCWRNFENELLNILNVYKVRETAKGKNLKNIFSENYSEFLVCDVNSDDKTDILIFDKITSNGTTEIKGTYYDFGVEEVVLSGEISLDPAISSIGSVCYDYESEYLRVYVDGYKTDTGITTDIIYWNEFENAFNRIESDDMASIATVATRKRNIYSADINGDSVIEIPIEIYIPGSEVITDTSGEVSEQNIIVWMQHDGYGLTEVQYEIFNSVYDYSFKFPAGQFGDFTLKNDLSTGLLTFYKLDIRGKSEGKKPKKKDEIINGLSEHNESMYAKAGEELFSILAVSDQNFEIQELNGYRLIAADNGFNYYYMIYQAGRDNGITKEMIKSMLST